MPVRSKTKPSSEYVKKFRWNDSVKSASFTPTKEQKQPEAGMTSMDFADSYAMTREPALQRRRKPMPVDNKVTYTTKQFMANIESEESSDIGKPSRKPGTSMAKTFVKKDKSPSRPPPEKDVKTAKNKAILAQTRIIPKSKDPPPPPTKTTRGPAIRKTERPVKGSGDAVKSNSKPQPDADPAMLYRAGIRARPGGPRHSSEYQRAFAWKQPPSKETPLMAAEQMVHNSNANLAPYIPDRIPRYSEYQLQFKQQQNPVSAVKEQLMQNAQQEIKAKYRVKTKSKKSKKPGASPVRLQPAGVPSVTQHDDPRLVKSSQNPQRPFFPHATTRKWRTEYKSNFKSPTVFSYEHGVWKGADPPHIQPRDDASDADRPKPPKRSKSVGDLPNWFAEVLELRERARDYQKRSRGTHFSREHIGQLLADQARMWEETDSNGQRSTSSSTQTSGSEKKDEQEKDQLAPKPNATKAAGQEVSPVRRKLAWPSGGGEENRPSTRQPRDVGLDNNRRSSSASMSTPEPYQSTSSLSSDIESIDENGRLPTPTLMDDRGHSRHHLDRTTPARGGALLTSPQSQKRAPPGPNPSTTYPVPGGEARPTGRTYIARSPPAKAIIPGGITKQFEYDSDDDDDSDEELNRTLTNVQKTPPKNAAQRKETFRYAQASPPAGSRTRDPHPINEQLSSPGFQRHSERFFETSPAMPTLPNKIEPPKTWAAPRGHLHKAAPGVTGPLERPHSGSIAGRPQTAVPETRQMASHRQQRLNSFMSPGSSATPADLGDDWGVSHPRGRRDSDELSMSTISNASSSTLASEVLERAKKRRDDFWGKEKTE